MIAIGEVARGSANTEQQAYSETNNKMNRKTLGSMTILSLVTMWKFLFILYIFTETVSVGIYRAC